MLLNVYNPEHQVKCLDIRLLFDSWSQLAPPSKERPLTSKSSFLRFHFLLIAFVYSVVSAVLNFHRIFYCMVFFFPFFPYLPNHECNFLCLVGWLQSLNAKTGLFSRRMKIIHSDPLLRAQRLAAIKVRNGKNWLFIFQVTIKHRLCTLLFWRFVSFCIYSVLIKSYFENILNFLARL